MKPIGSITRGTTNPNRLRRIDVWMAWRYQSLLRSHRQPLVVDLGFGATPVTTHELAQRLRVLSPQVEVIGLEISRERVLQAIGTQRSGVTFHYGGFEIPTVRKPLLVRALNVLRQYPEQSVEAHWRQMQSRLTSDGFLIDGTCDELGRKGSWIELDTAGPLTLSFAAQLHYLKQPSDLAPRLPKYLIHRNIPGEPIYSLMQAMDRAWFANAALSVYGVRQQWAAMVDQLRQEWPVVTPLSRSRHGEITIDWKAITSEGVARP